MLLHSPAQPGYKPVRIVSLVPSQTELLFDLGIGESVAGITKFCVHPFGWQKSKTIVGGTKSINLQKIKSCNPDLIIANKEENVREQIEELASLYNVWVTDVTNLDNALQMINDIGVLTQTPLAATRISTRVQENFSSISYLPNKLKTCYLIWRNPFMTAGGDTFISDMLTHCGLTNIYAENKRYPAIDINELREKGCELLLLSSEPFPFKQKHIVELQQQLPHTKIMLVDGEMFSWYGSRLLHAPKYFSGLIEQLA